jgi:uncharacterized protein YcfJ
MPFQMAETMNRATVSIAGFKEARAAERAAASPAYKATRKARELVDQTIVGAIGGGAAGYAWGDQDNRLGSTLAGATVGGAVAGGVHAWKGASTIERVQRTREAIAADKFVVKDRIFKDQMKDGLRPYTPDEINELYGAMVTDITQFYMGKAGRGTLMNTPMGQVFGSLQSYTINQADFVGGRMGSFWDSAKDVIAKKPGATLDTRVFRYAAFVMGTGSVYSAMFGTSTGHESPEYWMSRVGMGIMPWLRYDDNSKKWTLGDFGSVLGGPIVNDIWNTSNSYLKLMTDEDAQKSFLDVSDDVANKIFIGAGAQKRAQNIEDGKTLKSLTKEGLLGEGQPRGARQ